MQVLYALKIDCGPESYSCSLRLLKDVPELWIALEKFPS